MVLKKEVVLVQVWAARFLHEGVNHLIEKPAIMQRNITMK
jgi:hypothetical protein